MNTRKPNHDPRLLSRRSTLAGGAAGAGLITLWLTGCGSSDSDEQGDDAYSTPDPDRPLESPMLTEMVDAGDLPPLEERMPVEEDRLVIETPEFGVYGGTYHGAVRGVGDEAWLERVVGLESMLRIASDLSELGQPGTLKAIESNDDGTVYTLHMREGMRWSDGEPVNADDLMFNINDVRFFEELRTFPPDILTVENEPCTAEKIDELTVELTFPSPKGNFIELASHSRLVDSDLLWYPRHYMEQFHPSYNEDADEQAQEEGFSDWLSYWGDRHSWVNNPERPTLHAWVVTSPLNTGGVCTLERNPYYWKTDSEGAQLPFIDRMDFEVVQEDEVMLLKAVNGEIDFHSRHFTTDANRPVLADAQESGDFHLLPIQSTWVNTMVIWFNLNHEDEVMREVFNNKDFRIGLSHAIDRQEVIDTVFQRRGEPWQVAPRPGSEFYDEEFGTQYTEYDVDLANQYLDDAGYSETDSGGFRLGPDGDRIRFSLDVTQDDPQWAPAMQMIIDYWAEVGVEARVNSIERTLFYDRKNPSANEHDAAVWWGEGGAPFEEKIETRFWFPTNDESGYATRWANWYSTAGQGDAALEPPEEVRRQMDLRREMLVETDLEAQDEIFREILQIAKEQFYVMGVVMPDEKYAIAKNHMRNIPEGMTDSVVWSPPAYKDPCTWFFSD